MTGSLVLCRDSGLDFGLDWDPLVLEVYVEGPMQTVAGKSSSLWSTMMICPKLQKDLCS